MMRTKRKSYDVNGDDNLVTMPSKKNDEDNAHEPPSFTYDNAAVDLEEGHGTSTAGNLQPTTEPPPHYTEHNLKGQVALEFISMPNKATTTDLSTVDLGKPEDPTPENNQKGIIQGILVIRSSLSHFLKTHGDALQRIALVVITVLYFVYLGFAIANSWNANNDYCHGSKFLTVITIFAVSGVLYFYVLKKYFGRSCKKHIFKPLSKSTSKLWEKAIIRRIFYILLTTIVVVFLIIDSANNRQRLVSACGILVLVLIGFLFSKHPGQIIWRQVIWGLALQFVFALLILRWNAGQQLFQCLGNKVSYFFNFSDQGSAFVFGYLVTGKLKNWELPDNSTANDTMSMEMPTTNDTIPFEMPLQNAIFAFKVLPVIFFFSSCISILYHFGVMQWIVIKLGWLLQVTVGTTAAESINAAANIFVGQTEAPLVIKPFLYAMTKSELHAVMTGGFATIAGGVLAAYINFGVSASHLLSASVMSAPAALGFSKLFYPETEKSRTTAANIVMDRGSERNALEAAANGAANATFLVANIAANLIAFIALIAFINFTVSWFGALVGMESLSFEWILSKAFIPLAYIMGVEWNECELVAKLIGLKTVVNEFVAYAELATMIKGKQLSARAEAIATYALCGFSNLSSIGVQLGGLSAMAPQRRSDLAEIAVRALISGSIACFLTACIAGTLIDGR